MPNLYIAKFRNTARYAIRYGVDSLISYVNAYTGILISFSLITMQLYEASFFRPLSNNERDLENMFNVNCAIVREFPQTAFTHLLDAYILFKEVPLTRVLAQLNLTDCPRGSVMHNVTSEHFVVKQLPPLLAGNETEQVARIVIAVTVYLLFSAILVSLTAVNGIRDILANLKDVLIKLAMVCMHSCCTSGVSEDQRQYNDGYLKFLTECGNCFALIRALSIQSHILADGLQKVYDRDSTFRDLDGIKDANLRMGQIIDQQFVLNPDDPGDNYQLLISSQHSLQVRALADHTLALVMQRASRELLWKLPYEEGSNAFDAFFVDEPVCCPLDVETRWWTIFFPLHVSGNLKWKQCVEQRVGKLSSFDCAPWWRAKKTAVDGLVDRLNNFSQPGGEALGRPAEVGDGSVADVEAPVSEVLRPPSFSSSVGSEDRRKALEMEVGVMRVRHPSFSGAGVASSTHSVWSRSDGARPSEERVSEEPQCDIGICAVQ